MAQALECYGVRDVVVSPGSRNTPLIMAVGRCPKFNCIPVVDERSAAFIGLGIAAITARPVALVCTSGSALLNYAPAISEAYYRKLPLIVVSADRPAFWIGHDDSQTIKQPHALANFILGECDIPDREPDGTVASWQWQRTIDRDLNQLLSMATNGRRGPVHINVQIDSPISDETEADCESVEFHKIDLVQPEQKISVAAARELANEICNRRVLVFGGFHAPSAPLIKALNRLATLPGVVVAADRLANVAGAGIVPVSDALMKAVSERPELLITFGGAPLSGAFKQYVRESSLEHWHVGANGAIIDMSMQLSKQIEIAAEAFFPRFAGAACHAGCRGEATPFKQNWTDAFRRVREVVGQIAEMPWCDISALNYLMMRLPESANIQLGNGMSVRYASLCGLSRCHRVDSNRGVSGIDGCLSTAVGAAMAYRAGVTVALVGDMSALYDVGALASVAMCENLKIIVFSNQGGNIFRIVETTRAVDEAEQFMIGNIPPYMADTARGFGISYAAAHNFNELDDALALIARPGNCIIELHTDGAMSAAIYRRLMSEI